jgi:hypothetical protein
MLTAACSWLLQAACKHANPANKRIMHTTSCQSNQQDPNAMTNPLKPKPMRERLELVLWVSAVTAQGLALLFGQHTIGQPDLIEQHGLLSNSASWRQLM